MPDDDKSQVASGEPPQRATTDRPIIFISHDTRDAELAEAFSKLLTSVSAGVLKSFRSSDRRGARGIEYGVEWFPEIMKQLEKARDVVCLLTASSIDRPWILYEAGVAKGKLEASVFGIALGVSLGKASTGPFAQFQNCDDDEESLTKLVMQLVDRIPDSEPDHDAILMQVKRFKSTAADLLAKKDDLEKPGEEDLQPDNSAVAKMFEEVKVMFRDLPSRFESEGAEKGESKRRSLPRHFRHPMMVREILSMTGGDTQQNIALLILMMVCPTRDDCPWVYDLALDFYRVAMTDNPRATRKAFVTFRRTLETTVHGPMGDFFEIPQETRKYFRELTRVLDYIHKPILQDNGGIDPDAD